MTNEWNFKSEAGTVIFDHTSGIVLLTASKRKIETKDVFSRDWVEIDGIDPYLPPDRAVKVSDLELTFYSVGHKNTNPQKVDQFWRTLVNSGVVQFYDDITKRSIKLVLESIEEITNTESGLKNMIHFKLKFTSVAPLTGVPMVFVPLTSDSLKDSQTKTVNSKNPNDNI